MLKPDWILVVEVRRNASGLVTAEAPFEETGPFLPEDLLMDILYAKIQRQHHVWVLYKRS